MDSGRAKRGKSDGQGWSGLAYRLAKVEKGWQRLERIGRGWRVRWITSSGNYRHVRVWMDQARARPAAVTS